MSSPVPRLEAGQFLGEPTAGRAASGLSISEFRYDPGASLPRHTHSSAYFSFVIEGGYTEWVGATTWQCVTNTLRFHPAGEEHSDRFGNRGGVCLNIELPAAWLDEMWDGSADIPLATDECAFAALQLRDAGAGSGEQLDELMLVLLDGCGRVARTGVARQRVPWLGRVLDYVESALHRSVTLTEVAKVAGVHPTHFARVFRARMGVTLGAHLRRRRVARAQHLLRTRPDRTLSEIASMSGFADQAHLSRLFRDHTGLVPSLFRRIA